MKEIETIQNWLKTGSINIFGMPFAGKDSQASKLSEALECPVIGGGDILRNSVIPSRVKEIMHRGELIPIEDFLTIVLPYLNKEEFNAHPLILSSVGRWYGEEVGVVEALKKSDHELKAVVHLKLDERQVWRRWELLEDHDQRGQRHDDAADALEVRLKEFQVKTQPVIDFYKDIGLLIEVDAAMTIDEVFNQMTSLLASKASSHASTSR